MKVTKKGTIVQFSCRACGTEFVEGIKLVSTKDNGENYYANCPVCGVECHADCKDVKKQVSKNMNCRWRRFKVGCYRKAYKKARFKRMFARSGKQCIQMFVNKGVEGAKELYDKLYKENNNDSKRNNK